MNAEFKNHDPGSRGEEKKLAKRETERKKCHFSYPKA